MAVLNSLSCSKSSTSKKPTLSPLLSDEKPRNETKVSQFKVEESMMEQS